MENILTHWSVAQLGWNGEQNWRSKISLDCPFKLLYNVNYSIVCVQGGVSGDGLSGWICLYLGQTWPGGKRGHTVL